MNDLLFSCTDTLPQPTTPVCGTDYGERIVRVLLSKSIISCAGNVPTAEEFNLVYDTLTDFNHVTSGHRTFQGETEIDWHNKEWFDKTYRVEGRLRRVSEEIARAAEKFNYYHVVYMYYITEKNYCFGPYYAQPNFTLLQLEGKGSRPYISFFIDYVGNGIDYSQYDSGYDNLYDSVGSITADSTLITVDSTYITSDRI